MEHDDVLELSNIIARNGHSNTWCEELKVAESKCNSIRQSRESDEVKSLDIADAYVKQLNTCWKRVVEVLCVKLHNAKGARDLAEKHGVDFNVICT